ncbi:hypothetical protein GCK32_019221 [Trichostrongylus colubriformis]|uniref:Uncharacterized protein n=1 Tax=Trichostrongylus colubriformis TaxID=6319 RepID=A0AAN8FME7_TRICO
MVTVEKMQKVDEGYGGEKLVSMPSKSTKSEDPELSAEIRPSRMRKTPKWLEDSAFYV